MVATARVKYILHGCTRKCTLNPQNLPPGVGEMVHRWLEEKTNNPTVVLRAAELGVHLTNGSIGRHKMNHLHNEGGEFTVDADEVKLSDLEVIERVIQRGARQADLATTKVTTEQLLRAIELKNKLTMGSVFDSMYDAMQGKQGPDDDELEDLPNAELPAAIRAPDEAAQAGSE